MTAKVFGLVAYIVLGSVAVKAGRRRGIRLAAWLAALAIFAYVASVALAEPLGLSWRAYAVRLVGPCRGIPTHGGPACPHAILAA